MTREEARKAAEVMRAYVEGKDIEYKLKGNIGWMTFRGDDNERQLCFDFTTNEYRIKPEPTYRPFKDKEECWTEMQKHQPFGWVKGITGVYQNITALNHIGVYFPEGSHNFENIMKCMTFADGAPFGIKVKE